jgi:hypothetical protein
MLSVALSLTPFAEARGPPGVTRHRRSVEPGLSSPRLREPRPPGPLARAIWVYCGRGSKSASNLARHSPSTMPSIRSGRKRRWKAITAFCVVGHVIAEALEREQEAGVGPKGSIRSRVGLGSASRAWPARPREQLARILLARRGDVGMADDIAAADAVALLDVGDQRDQRGDLLVGKRAIAEFVAGIDDLDPDAGRIDVGDAAPSATCRRARRASPRRPGDRPRRPRRPDNGAETLASGRVSRSSAPRRRACRYNGGRSSTPAAPARRNWAKGVDDRPCAHGAQQRASGQEAARRARRASRPGCRRRRR